MSFAQSSYDHHDRYEFGQSHEYGNVTSHRFPHPSFPASEITGDTQPNEDENEPSDDSDLFSTYITAELADWFEPFLPYGFFDHFYEEENPGIQPTMFKVEFSSRVAKDEPDLSETINAGDPDQGSALNTVDQHGKTLDRNWRRSRPLVSDMFEIPQLTAEAHAFMTNRPSISHSSLSLEERIDTSHTAGDNYRLPIEESQRRYRLLPIQIGQSAYDAFPDTGSSRNVMTEARAKQLGLAIDRRAEKRHKFTNACGKTFHAIGETSIEVSLPGTSRSGRLEIFSVVQKCAASIVVGNAFLSKHRIFHEAQYRIKKVVSTAITRLCRLMYMDVPQERLRCSVNGSNALAVVDSGSEKNFLSLRYLQRSQLAMTRLPRNRGYVELADGTLVRATGYVDVVFEVDNVSGVRRFYVLDNLVCDVLLGDETIEELDLFVEHAACFVHVDEEHDAYQFQMLEWVDELIDQVNTFLEDPDAILPSSLDSFLLGGVTSKESSWNRLRRKFKGGNSKKQRYRVLKSGIATALEKVDIVEADNRKRREAAITAALDNEKKTLQDEDRRAQEQHNIRRRKLLEHKENLAQWKAGEKT